MAKNRRTATALAVLALAFCGGAWAQDVLEFTVQEGPKYAKELFGEGSDTLELDYSDSQGPKAILKVVRSGGISSGQAAEIEFTLIGAVFAQRVSVNDLALLDGDGSESTELSIRHGRDGREGGNSVTYRVETTAEIAQNEKIVFTLPSLEVESQQLADDSTPGVQIRVSVVPKQRADADSFPDKEYEPKEVLANAEWALKLTADDGEPGSIDLDDRQGLTPATPQRLKLASVQAVVDRSLAQSDGDKFSLEPGSRGASDGEGTGFMVVTASGPLHRGDRVYLDIDGDLEASSDEELTVQGTEASTDFDLGDLLPPSKTKFSAHVWYEPNGRDLLRPGMISTTFAIEYDRDTNRNPEPQTRTVSLEYAGASNARAAYAIPPVSSQDRGNVRVKCESTTACQTYFACDGADGEDLFGKVPDLIDPRATEVFDAQEIEEIVGEWKGRLSCNVIASQDISVQVLTRSGGVLVNNTYVNDRQVQAVEEKVQAALEAIQELAASD